jgi:diacylglycerol kinase family enzyme
MIKLAAIVNGNARNNKGSSAGKEARKLQKILSHLKGSRVDVTSKSDLVSNLCREYSKEHIDAIILSGGDGTIQNFVTMQFKQLYREHGKGMSPIEFASKLNSTALDPDSEINLPAIHHRKRGTVNVYADTLGMDGNIERILENIEEADFHYPLLGKAAFRRVYVPMIMIYPRDKPDDLDMIQLQALYADATLRNFYEQYYLPKKHGGDSNVLTAGKLIARCAYSITVGKILDTAAETLLGSRKTSVTVYSDRYIDRIMNVIECSVKIDGREVCNERTLTAVGTMGVSLYGLKPFWRMPDKPQAFRRSYAPGIKEYAADFADSVQAESMHVLVGKPDTIDLVKELPKVYAGKRTKISGLTDMLAKRLEIEQKEPLKIICDGSRHDNGKSAVVQIAYLQPFILFDDMPMS